MAVPSLNSIGGIFAVLGLAAVIYFGAHAADCPPLAPATVVTPAAVAPPVVKDVAPTPAPPKKRPLTFRTVKKMDCNWVPAVTKNYSKEQITSAAQQYGLSTAQVLALRACLK